MKEQFVKLSDVAELLDNAALVGGCYDEPMGYRVSDVDLDNLPVYRVSDVDLDNLPVYEFEVPDETIEDKKATAKQFANDMFERLFERESRDDPNDNYLW